MSTADERSDAPAVRELRAVLERAAREASRTRGRLLDATADLRSVRARVVETVGGSASGIDREVVTALEKAFRRIDRSAELLAACGSAARLGR